MLVQGCDLNRQDTFGLTALSYAIKNNNYMIVKVLRYDQYLLKYGAAPFKDGVCHYKDYETAYPISLELKRFRIVREA